MGFENLTNFQLLFLAFIQGATEFLPISSSGHLLLPSLLLGWADQGLLFDVVVHLGSLVAVVSYFRKEFLSLFCGGLRNLFGIDGRNEKSDFAWKIILGTLPAGVFGLFFSEMVESVSRSLTVLSVTSIIFGLLLLAADKSKALTGRVTTIFWWQVLVIGFAQALALIPGVSRSGVTITAALFCGISRDEALRFSFFLSVPIIVASGCFKFWELSGMGLVFTEIPWAQMGIAFFVAGLVAFSCIHFCMRVVSRIGFFPFAVYRLIFGFGLLFWLI